MDFSNLKILVIGDVCLDVIEEGESTRLSPEAPVPVILNPTENYSLGMAANVLSNLVNLGADVDFSFTFGTDYYGNIFAGLIKEQFKHSSKPKYKENTIEKEKEIKTIVKKRIFSNSHQVARIDYEYKIDEAYVAKKLTDYLENKINERKKYNAIIISDYNKGTITEFTWKCIKPLLEELSDNIFVDTKKLDILNYFKGVILFPNTKEINSIMEYNNFKTKKELLAALYSPFIIETASENGAYLYDGDKIITCKAYKESVVDICGCGDTFMAAFILFYLKFNARIKSLDFANYCASKVSQKKGTASVYLNEVMDFKNAWEK